MGEWDRRDSHMKNNTKILIAAILLLAISIGLTSIVRVKREETEMQLIAGLSSGAVDSFSDLLYQLQQGETDYELSYRRAICNFYALYHGVIFLSDIHNRDCSYKREMSAVYAYLLTRSEIDAETVEIIRTACQAIGRKESESSIGEWLLRARNSMME